MTRKYRRTPRNYDGIDNPIIKMNDLLPGFIQSIEKSAFANNHLIIEAWPQVIGHKMAPLTKAVAFKDKVLIVKVKSSTLYSLLCQYEKQKILQKLQDRFSQEAIKDIIFRMV